MKKAMMIELALMIRDGKIVAIVTKTPGYDKCVMQWLGRFRSVAVYESFQDLENIHGHDGTYFHRRRVLVSHEDEIKGWGEDIEWSISDY